MAAAKKTAEGVVPTDVPAEPTPEVKAEPKFVKKAPSAKTAASIGRSRARRNAERVRKGRPSKKG